MTLTATRTRRTGTLAALAVVLLALAFATGLVIDRYGPFGRAGRTSKTQQQLASDNYTPTGLDYREEHRHAVPAAAPGNPSQQQQPARLDATFYGQAGPAAPAADPRAAQQRQRPAWLDARDYGPADGGAAPLCNGDAAVLGNACTIP